MEAASAQVGPDELRSVLVSAAGEVGLEVSSCRLLRLGENAVFALEPDVIARVIRSGASAEAVARTVAVARWLRKHEVPAVEALDVDQPVGVGDRLVTFWRSLGDGEHYGSTMQLASLLRRLHTLDQPTSLHLPAMDPFDRASRRLLTAPLSEDDARFLSQRLDQLRDQFSALEFQLGTAVLHDDASVGNVLVDQDGVARLIDLDGFCIGPREWDLILTAIYYDRYGWHTREEYEAFCEVYGADVMAWDGYETLADIRELVMVTWMAQDADRDEKTGAEVAKRIDALRHNRSRKDWNPF
jgi:aminoglycoside phosphotransferase